MGEIADAMIGGEMCVMCGMYLEGDGYGIPRACSNECARDYGAAGMQTDGALIYEKKDFDGSEFAAPDSLDLSI